MKIKTLIERREAERVSFPFKVMHSEFQLMGKSASLNEGLLINISATGFLFLSDKEYKEGDMIRAEVYLGSWENCKSGFRLSPFLYQGEPFVVLAKVIRTHKNEFDNKMHVAVNYVSVDYGHQLAVKKFINKLMRKTDS